MEKVCVIFDCVFQNKTFLLQEGKAVYFVFSVQGTGQFQGYAKVTSVLEKEKSDSNAVGLGSSFVIEWIKRYDSPDVLQGSSVYSKTHI